MLSFFQTKSKNGETSLITEQFWIYRANVVVTSQCVTQSHRMGSSTCIATLVPDNTASILTF